MIWAINPSSLISSSPNIVSRLVPRLVFASRRSSRSRYLSSRSSYRPGRLAIASRFLSSLFPSVPSSYSSFIIPSCSSISLYRPYRCRSPLPHIVQAPHCVLLPCGFIYIVIALTLMGGNRADKNGASPVSSNDTTIPPTQRRHETGDKTSRRRHGHETATSEMIREQKENETRDG